MKIADQGQGHRVTLKFFLHLPQYKLSSPISQLWNKLGSCDEVCVLIIQ